MKKFILLTIIYIGLLGALKATIIRVNNSGLNADYDNLQTAVDAATAGDTIHVEGSGVSYGNVSLSKKLIMIGPEYFLGQNPDTQVNLAPAKIANLSLFDESGSPQAGDQTLGSVGSVFMGLEISSVKLYVNNILFKRCRIIGDIRNERLGANLSGLVIDQCFIDDSIHGGGGLEEEVLRFLLISQLKTLL